MLTVGNLYSWETSEEEVGNIIPVLPSLQVAQKVSVVYRETEEDYKGRAVMVMIRANKVDVKCLRASVPFLVLQRDGVYVNILFENKLGWILDGEPGLDYKFIQLGVK